MKALLLGVIFLLELALLGSAGYWGLTLGAGRPLRLLAGLGAPLVIAVVWGLFCSPRAAVTLPTRPSSPSRPPASSPAACCSPWPGTRPPEWPWWLYGQQTRPR
nr:YrdB family protein [Micromonospora provocatoris]